MAEIHENTECSRNKQTSQVGVFLIKKQVTQQATGFVLPERGQWRKTELVAIGILVNHGIFKMRK